MQNGGSAAEGEESWWRVGMRQLSGMILLVYARKSLKPKITNVTTGTVGTGVGGFGGLQELRDMNKPVIAAVNGIACGGGLELALSADIILAADHASFALPEIRSGTVADAASVKLPKRIPYHIAMELLLTGRWFDVDEAHRWGLVNEIVPTAGLMDRAWDMARLLASGPPLVYAAIKEIVRDAEDAKFQDAMNRITKSQLASVEKLYRSDDQLEGARAFAEKRDPVWKGR